MNALYSRIARLELKGGSAVLGRFIVLGGDPSPTDGQVSEFLKSQRIRRGTTDLVLIGNGEPIGMVGAPLTLVEIISITRPHEEALAAMEQAS